MSSYRVTLRSIANFDSLQTILVDYLLMPLISLILFLLIAFNSTQDYTRVLIGTAVTTGVATGIGIISASSVYDQNINILDDIVSIRPSIFKYWLPKFVIASIATVVEVILLGSIGLILLGKSYLLWKLFLSLPLIIIISCLLGYFGSVLGIKRENPYWLTNFFSASLVIFSGVIIPVSEYPAWLKIFAELFPISNILDWTMTSSIINSDLLIIITKLLIWTMVCVITDNIVLSKNT
ncbi:ABC-2 type transport system permease protein [Lactobacillus colini]|uniref:ABC-2 type transport system permease protein n=1 Tax=Lactobacillus colini TaxID=1819254 RepID=A0ABS4MHA8_9LACO|nr:ABC transporter permease [Lactobacillus colini]MBP2058726.1 ABC-2 type transport system permease protein [Lactobacillus colini]